MDDELAEALDEAKVSPWAVIEQLPVPVSLISLDGGQLAANAAYWELMGRAPDQPVDVESLTHPDDRSITAEYLAELRRGERERIDLEKRYVRGDGSGFHGHLRSRRLTGPDGEVVGLVGVITDATERIEAQEALRRQLRRSRRILDGLRDVVLECSAEGAVLERHGASWWDGDVTTSHLSELLRVDGDPDGRRIQELMATVIRDGFVVDELDLVDGRVVVFHAVDQTAEPDVGTVVVTLREVTGERSALAELRAERDRAEQESLRTAAFLAEAAHDIRSPLQGVVGLVELLAARQPEARGWWTDELVRAARGLADLVGEVLDVSRFHQRVDVEPQEPISLPNLLGELQLAAQLAARPGVSVESEVAPSVPEVVTLAEKPLRRVLQNLLSNAVAHTGEGSVRLVADEVGGDLVVRVVDTGPGIAPEDLESVFEPGVSRGAHRGAAGLGLSIARTMAGRLGGTLTVDSQLGVGTTFELRLPGGRVEHPLPGEEERDAAVTAPDLAGRTVLVVEDDDLNRRILATQLRAAGLEVVEAGDGESGLRWLERSTADAVILDGRLPGIHGDEVAAELRRRQTVATGGGPLPIVGLSASLLATDGPPGDYDLRLAKPATAAQLLDVLRRVMAHVGHEDTPATSGSATTTGELLDLGHLDRLVDEVGDVSIVEQVLGAFRDSLAERSGTVRAAAERGDHDAVAVSLHALASASLTVGAVVLGEWCRTMEHRSADDVDLAELDELVAATARSVDRWRQSAGGSSSR